MWLYVRFSFDSQEVYKIPKKQVLEERKKTERELDSNYENVAKKLEERKKKGNEEPSL